jgi:hypothetical protein
MSYSMSYGRIVQAAHGPPENELPAVLAPRAAIMWRGDGIVIAVPSLLAYSTGVWLLILCRTRDEEPRAIEHTRATSDALRGLTANSRAVELLGGEYAEHGFTYRGWVQFHEDGSDFTTGITFRLEWPGITPGEHHVDGLQEATRQVVVLWPSGGEQIKADG